MSEPASGPLRMLCPACGGRVKIPAGGQGQRFRCPRCDAQIRAPAASPPPLSVPRTDPTPPLEPQPEPPLEVPEPQPEVPHLKPPEALPPEPPQLDRLPVPDAAADADDQFPVTCPLCGSLQYARRSQIGRAIRCIDCHTPIAVRPPQPRPRPAPAPSAADDEEYRLSDLVERPPPADVHAQLFRAAEQHVGTEPAPESPPGSSAKPAGDNIAPRAGEAPGSSREPSGVVRGGDIIAQRAREVLERAHAEWEQTARQQDQLSPRPLYRGLWSFLLDAEAAARWVALVLISLGVAVLVRWFFELLSGGPLQQFGAVITAMLAGPLTLVYVAVASVSFLAVIQDTSNGLEKIEQWPGLSFLDWVFDAFYVINSLFVAALPGVLLGQVPAALGWTAQWPAVLLGTFTALIVFPVLLLSALDTGSPLGMWSPPVFRGFLGDSGRVMRFYLASAGLAGMGLAGLGLLMTEWLLIRAAGAAALNLALLVYARLLGRLAGLISEDLSAAGDEEGDRNPA